MRNSVLPQRVQKHDSSINVSSSCIGIPGWTVATSSIIHHHCQMAVAICRRGVLSGTTVPLKISRCLRTGGPISLRISDLSSAAVAKRLMVISFRAPVNNKTDTLMGMISSKLPHTQQPFKRGGWGGRSRQRLKCLQLVSQTWRILEYCRSTQAQCENDLSYLKAWKIYITEWLTLEYVFAENKMLTT